ncbi:MAG: hypothetical protein AABX89_01065 [Candidatus Thermoplasmatota archaeon]
MRVSTPVLAATALILVGAATFFLAASQGEANVRQVEQIVGDPAAHEQGTYTLVGIPQPELVPGTGPEGTRLMANEDAVRETKRVVAWSAEGVAYHSVLSTRVAQADGAFVWTVRNETRVVGATSPSSTTNLTFRLPASGQVFPVQGFDVGGGTLPAVWAWYELGTKEPLQAKPSQFIGRLLTELPDGTPIPDGVLIWHVESYLSSCSSKFTPPEVAEKYNLTA